MKLVDQRTGLEAMEREECLQLLAGEEVGRVGVVVGGTVHVVPVNFVLDGDAIVFRTGIGNKLYGANRAPASFEVDHIDRTTRSGWSVIVRGLAREITSSEQPDVVQRLWALDLHPWVPGDHSHLVRIPTETITGRRIRPQPDRSGPN